MVDRVFNDTLSPSALVSSLAYAIDNNELRVQYQPRHDVDTGKIQKFEALVRWQKPEVGLVYPGEFIDIATQHDLIFSLDLMVFEQCCKDLDWLRSLYKEQIKIAVNISVSECESLFHTQKLLAICEQHGLSMADFEFEITETGYMSDYRKVEVFCHTMTEHGASISLDNIGTGNSPLASLSNLTIDLIKIDRSFVQNTGKNNRVDILMNHLIDIANEMELKIVATGIETDEQMQKMVEMGCHQLQGFHISPPLPPGMMLNYLQKTNFTETVLQGAY